MEQKRLCPYCMGELPPAADSCVHCGKVFAGRNPAGCLPVGTVLAGRYTVGEMRSLDGEGILYRGVENLGCFRVTIKEYLPVTLSAERGADCILQPKTGSEVLFKTTRMDFADLYRALERITPATGLEAVLDVVEANNTVYAVMENLGGTPLDQWLEAQGAPLRPDDACAMLQPVFEGVAAMHKIGLVHRGICPENLRVMADGRCRLAGYATVGLRTAGSGLREQLYEGYSAPEQYSTAEFEGRYTDEYGLAAVFYRMVCGQAPVPAAQRMVSDSNPRARTVNSAVPGDISRADFLRILQFMTDYTFVRKPVAGAGNEVRLFRMPLWKRAFDIAASLSAILLLSPLLIAVAVAVRLDSPGPVIYKSKRVGSNYRIFDFLKFRSMRSDADRRLKELEDLNQYASAPAAEDDAKMTLDDEEIRKLLADTENGMLYADDFVIPEEAHQHQLETEQENAFVKIENDPRITRLGRFLRKYSIDELPQLFNILRGDMSVVGNRPLPLYEAERLTSDEYIERFMCPSGLTGLWQVEKRGQAGKLSPEQRKQLDIEYARRMSPWFDLKIILRTFTAFIQKENV